MKWDETNIDNLFKEIVNKYNGNTYYDITLEFSDCKEILQIAEEKSKFLSDSEVDNIIKLSYEVHITNRITQLLIDKFSSIKTKSKYDDEEIKMIAQTAAVFGVINEGLSYTEALKEAINDYEHEKFID